ncbi:uroporphyrinogen-III C-methyltransferase [Neorhizobium petrolearium]|uniref:uroporphyrinogen-III C-methyltransferase n=1 Tax=Neorhizobium petrolearium TaxID=515361 RepID=A0ABY8LZU6_9HYPH|nr:uroporphyrinogen-III C-methyltransferase [Neorhizobium petrolearium]MCC2612727.1 uroporphyrinogen-III C-methyltransferase [Neorhizobium petrolearium]WGI67847.1 uroporphyrinogen-III C-methyltransferase [Neorhizobium petrolearium]
MHLNEKIQAIIEAPVFQPGHVWLAGAGPGHPRYLTLEVADAIGKADVIVHDALVSEDVLSLAKTADLIFVGKRGGKPSVAQDDITTKLIELAREGKRVLRLKGGDPFVFGRGGEEAEALARENISFRILPGMTSALAALAAANIPATMRGISRAITLATGHAAGTPGDLDWKALAKTGEPIVVYMGVSTIGTIAKLLMEGGLPSETPVAVLMAATMPGERSMIATLATVEAEIERQNFAAPALIVIGRIVSMQTALSGQHR